MCSSDLGNPVVPFEFRKVGVGNVGSGCVVDEIVPVILVADIVDDMSHPFFRVQSLDCGFEDCPSRLRAMTSPVERRVRSYPWSMKFWASLSASLWDFTRYLL